MLPKIDGIDHYGVQGEEYSKTFSDSLNDDKSEISKTNQI